MKKSKRKNPPRAGEWILNRLLPKTERFEKLGDFAEAFAELVTDSGEFRAKLWYWGQILKAAPAFFENFLCGRATMFKNYLLLTFRNFINHRGISFINIAGLAIGMACAILVLMWVNDQLVFEKSQLNADHIYRLETTRWANMPTQFRTPLSTITEIKHFSQFNHWENPTLRYKDRALEIKDFCFADRSVFDIFTLPFIQGDPKKALEVPFSLVLTESNAVRIFGEENPLGKIIRYDERLNYTVTGIIEDVDDLHILIGAIAPFEDMPVISGRKNFLNEANWNHITYLLIPDSNAVSRVENRINSLLSENRILSTKYLLRPFKDIYFNRGLGSEKGVKHGNMQLITLFSIVAAFILCIAWINFINLATARSSVRSKEICVRKVAGAAQKHLVAQFFVEVILFSITALAVSLLLVYAAIPTFNRLLGADLIIDFFNPVILAGIAIIFVATVIGAGTFPSAYLSRFSPVAIFQKQQSKQARGAPLRKTLIVVQFCLSIMILTGTLAVLKQLQFMKNRDMGFTIEQIVNVRLKGILLQPDRKHLFREQLLKNPDILKISFSNQVPGSVTNTNTWRVAGKSKEMKIVNTDPEFLDLMELELIEGRNFSRDFQSDMATKYIVNETAAKFLEVKPLLGARFRANFGNSEIIGVVKDYHFNSLHSKIGPLAICWYEHWARTANIKISAGRITPTISYIKQVWHDLNPSFPFNYSFLDESFGRQYQLENRLADLLKYFVILTVFLASLGLLGLSSFITEQRTKEIGIRKVLGSTTRSAVFLLSKDFIKWVILANLVACPLAYLGIRKWLENFAYRTTVGPGIFVLSGLLALTVALFTVSIHTYKAARANPVESLRYE